MRRRWSVDTLDSDLDLALLSAAETSLHVRPDTAGLRAHLGRFTSLRHLHAHRCAARDLAALAAHPSLEGILLEADEAPDASWSELLASLPSLRSVRVVLPWRAFRAALARVASLPRLTSLTLECVGDTPDADGLAALSAARALARLVVSRRRRRFRSSGSRSGGVRASMGRCSTSSARCGRGCASGPRTGSEGATRCVPWARS